MSRVSFPPSLIEAFTILNSSVTFGQRIQETINKYFFGCHAYRTTRGYIETEMGRFFRDVDTVAPNKVTALIEMVFARYALHRFNSADLANMRKFYSKEQLVDTYAHLPDYLNPMKQDEQPAQGHGSALHHEWINDLYNARAKPAYGEEGWLDRQTSKAQELGLGYGAHNWTEEGRQIALEAFHSQRNLIVERMIATQIKNRLNRPTIFDDVFRNLINKDQAMPPSNCTPIKIETKTLVNGVDVATMGDDALFMLIQSTENEIKRLSSIENKPNRLQKRINELQKGINELVSLSNSREPVTGDTVTLVN